MLAAALFLTAVRPAQAQIAIDPISWGLAPGTTFQLVFVTFGTTDATSTNIADYDAFVNSQYVNQITYNGSPLSWQAIGLTQGSSPVSDNSRYSSTANAHVIYNLNGQQVSTTTNGSAFWQTNGYNQHVNPINYTVTSGGSLSASAYTYAWTGFDWDGSAPSSNAYDSNGNPQGVVSSALGLSVDYFRQTYDEQFNPVYVAATLSAAFGRIPAVANGWAAIGDDQPLSTLRPIYAISSVITVAAIPEPSTYAVAAGLLALAAAAWRRRRRR